MRTWRLGILRQLAALLPMLLLVLSSPAQAMLRCRMDGSLRAACCCPETAKAATKLGPHHHEATLKPQSCCQPHVNSTERPVAEAPQSTCAGEPRVAEADELGTLLVAALADDVAPSTWRYLERVRDVSPHRDCAHAFLIKFAFLV